jgi:hypothetical protein
MKALFIGGTGTISAAISRKLLERGWELWLLNRGNRNGALPKGAREIRCDITDEAEAAKKLAGLSFDVVADFIVKLPGDAMPNGIIGSFRARPASIFSSVPLRCIKSPWPITGSPKAPPTQIPIGIIPETR